MAKRAEVKCSGNGLVYNGVKPLEKSTGPRVAQRVCLPVILMDLFSLLKYHRISKFADYNCFFFFSQATITLK